MTLTRADVAGLMTDDITDHHDAPPVLLSPDLHFDTADLELVQQGTAPIVLGELHWGLQGLGNLCALLPRRDRLRDAVRHWLHSERPELVHVATKDRFGKLCYLELLPRSLELTGPAAPGQQRLTARELDVHRDGRVVERGTGQWLALLLGDPQGATQSPLGVPGAAWPTVDLGEFTPRLLLEDVVVQRAAWRIGAGQLPGAQATGLERYLRTVEWLSQQGVPRHCFAAVAGERKPIYLDQASPHLVDLLHSKSKGNAVRITEMLPQPDRLWQSLGAGRRVCEMRFAVVRREFAEAERGTSA